MGRTGGDLPVDYGNNFNSINPDDIESVTVLKGATASALYGSRGANGAIMITTKSGKYYSDGFGSMFEDAKAFNQPLNHFDTGLVVNFSSMFSGAVAFNQPLNNWNTSSGRDFRNMFQRAAAFNQDINSWDMRKAEIMSSMFERAVAFNTSIDGWKLEKVISLQLFL